MGLLTTWVEEFGGQSILTREIPPDGPSGNIIRLMLPLPAPTDRIKAWGHFLAKNEGRVKDGLCLQRVGHRGGSTLWTVAPPSSSTERPRLVVTRRAELDAVRAAAEERRTSRIAHRSSR
jgi:hypothetical protein